MADNLLLLVMRSNSAVGRASYALTTSGEYAQKRLERAAPRVLMLTFEHSRWEWTRIDLDALTYKHIYISDLN